MPESFRYRFLNRDRWFLRLAYYGLLNRMPDRPYLERRFQIKVGYRPDLDNPSSFNEKLQWLKLHDRNPDYIRMVDKYEVKQYISDTIGAEYVIPTLGVWDSFDEIDFTTLPQRFVLKCTHDSGGLFIVRDKSHMDMTAARDTINRSLKRNFYYHGREWIYKNIRPRILAETYLPDLAAKAPVAGHTVPDADSLPDYKLMCFNGQVKCSFVCSDRFSDKGLHVTFFDTDWKKMPFERHYPASDKTIARPEHYDTMVRLAETLSRDIPFVRVDFYELGGKVFFGELTFFPGCGFEEFTPREWDYKLGSWLELPQR